VRGCRLKEQDGIPSPVTVIKRRLINPGKRRVKELKGSGMRCLTHTLKQQLIK